MVSLELIAATFAPLVLSYVYTDRTRNHTTQRWYDNLHKSSLNPPSWIFPIVWPVLYLMMGYASYLVARKVGWISIPLMIYLLQLLINLSWSDVFFKDQNPEKALNHQFLLLLLVILTIYSFYKVDRSAAYFLVPYIFWLFFATYLNWYIVRNN